jgi:hypothetical protein
MPHFALAAVESIHTVSIPGQAADVKSVGHLEFQAAADIGRLMRSCTRAELPASSSF